MILTCFTQTNSSNVHINRLYLFGIFPFYFLFFFFYFSNPRNGTFLHNKFQLVRSFNVLASYRSLYILICSLSLFLFLYRCIRLDHWNGIIEMRSACDKMIYSKNVFEYFIAILPIASKKYIHTEWEIELKKTGCICFFLWLLLFIYRFSFFFFFNFWCYRRQLNCFLSTNNLHS